MDLTLPKKGITPPKPFLPTVLLTAVLTYGMLIPIVISHLFLLVYNAIAMPLMGIPRVSLRDYLVIDRQQLQKLNWIQKLNCLFCGYANGVAAWSKATTNTTEVYSCAIKHSVVKQGQDHHEDFYPYNQFR